MKKTRQPVTIPPRQPKRPPANGNTWVANQGIPIPIKLQGQPIQNASVFTSNCCPTDSSQVGPSTNVEQRESSVSPQNAHLGACHYNFSSSTNSTQSTHLNLNMLLRSASKSKSTPILKFEYGVKFRCKYEFEFKLKIRVQLRLQIHPKVQLFTSKFQSSSSMLR